MKYLHNVWNNSFVNLDLKIKLFNSLVMSVLMYSMETIPSLKTFETRLKIFIISCYKRILRIHKDVEIKEKDLSEILGIYTVDKIWRKRRINAYSHIARLPYDNPARVVLLGKMIHSANGPKRKFANVKRTMMKDINKFLNESTYCNLCDKKIRSTIYTST